MRPTPAALHAARALIPLEPCEQALRVVEIESLRSAGVVKARPRPQGWVLQRSASLPIRLTSLRKAPVPDGARAGAAGDSTGVYFLNRPTSLLFFSLISRSEFDGADPLKLQAKTAGPSARAAVGRPGLDLGAVP